MNIFDFLSDAIFIIGGIGFACFLAYILFNHFKIKDNQLDNNDRIK